MRTGGLNSMRNVPADYIPIVELDEDTLRPMTSNERKLAIGEHAVAKNFHLAKTSTVIRVTYDDYMRLCELVPKTQPSVPSDIIDGNIVPIRSLTIELDQRPFCISKFDIFLVDRNKEEDRGFGIVLSIFYHDEDLGTRIPGAVYSLDGLLQCHSYAESVHKGITKEAYEIIVPLWYGIQISLLHPAIKEVFRHSGIMSDKDREESKDYKKRPLYYQKVKTINQREFDEVVKRNIVRKTLIWYVIGHWRNYKDGRRIFIQPYWKGALRETRMTETPRERVI